MYHVAFIQKEPLSRILSGRKTVECRLSVNRPPAWETEAGDFILFKETGGDIRAIAKVQAVVKFDGLTPDDVGDIAEMVSDLTGSSPQSQYWQMKRTARYAVLIELESIQEVSFPRQLTPVGVMSAWVKNFQHGHLARMNQEGQDTFPEKNTPSA